MLERKELEKKKRRELCEAIAKTGFSHEEAEKIFEFLEDECFVEITPPTEREHALQTIKILDVHTGRFSGKSYKPGNIIINVKDCLGESLAFAASTVASIGAISAAQPVIAFFTILSAVISAVNLSSINLDDQAVLILAVLWQNRQSHHSSIDAATSFDLVNKYLKSYDREPLSMTQFYDLLKDLESAGCITLVDGKVMLLETIHMKY